MNFKKILQKYRISSISERNKGDRFEQIIKAYFFTDPKYSDIPKRIWLWNEFPFKSQFGGNDTGIDLVIYTNSDEYWAVQCKCVAEGTYIDKSSVDSFLSTSAKNFENDRGDIYRFSQRIWVSTSNNWSTTATDTLKNQTPPVTRINLYDLETAPVDWSKLEDLVHGSGARTEIWEPKPHQRKAIDKVLEHFKNNDRGKLIMACGTGKTFTSLRLAEEYTNGKGMVLFLVPSIALLSQSLREWTAQARSTIDPICICSDPKVSQDKKNSEDTTNFSVIDLALPASTNIAQIKRQLDSLADKKDHLKVVFSTYQSIDVISKAQKELGFEFDLTICDEAHRTTGATRLNESDAAFVKVHDQDVINSKKRLYMTATPRLYGEEAKAKAAASSIELASMDDEKKYGQEIHRVGFSEAVEKGLLSDYKVLILTLNESQVPAAVQQALSHSTTEINTDDASKLVGCINALSKHIIGDGGTIDGGEAKDIMRRAVAFTPKIKDSKKISQIFNEIGEVYKDAVPTEKQQSLALVKSKHIDGSMDATTRDQLMSWLKENAEDPYECRILTNVRCLSEGVDVPSLDAVMFLSAKNSQVDVVQSVGRVMRTSPGKKYGYIIIPVVIPDGVKPEVALNDNERYKVVWTVLNALRAHDDRFNATINKIELNKSKPTSIVVGSPDPNGTGDEPLGAGVNELPKPQQQPLFNELQNAIFAKLVEKVGERGYWEQWAKDVAKIAVKQIEWIEVLIHQDVHREDFENFLNGLRKNINPSITAQQAIEMLAQHIITKPVFEALFEGYSFVQNNAVSQSMQNMLDVIETTTVAGAEEDDTLERFYLSVRRRVEGIDNAEGKQKIITELYDRFFKNAFPKMVEQLGIVYTPIEVVDFIIHSVNDVLKKEFGKTLSDENVNILDPFTGTGTFVTRLLQSGLIKPEDLERKYKKEIFANEIVLLAYYIAAVNIENTYHDLIGKESYESFEGIVLTDTFQMYEEDSTLISDSFTENNERVERQKNAPIQVIIGNPPYSVGQSSANDSAKNISYPSLEKRISETYVANLHDNTLKQSLYDAYIKAFRWASDRIEKEGGVVGFVSNGAWIDGKATSGFRNSLEKELSSIYVFNLRGNQRTSGELSRKEGGKIFGSGSRTPISITLLIKNPDVKKGKAEIFYYDIGDYLSREQKLEIISNFKSINTPTLTWQRLQPNNHSDWINKRNNSFSKYPELGSKKTGSPSYFNLYSAGVITHRDAWVYDFDKKKLEEKLASMIDFFNQESMSFQKIKQQNPHADVEKYVNKDGTKIKWNRRLFEHAKKGMVHKLKKEEIVTAIYRPFMKQYYYFNKDLNWSRYLQPKIFPNPSTQNFSIIVTGIGSSKDFSVIVTDKISDIQTLMNGQTFPLYYYEKSQDDFFDGHTNDEYIRHDGVSDFILQKAQTQYSDTSISKKDIFYYVYGFLHSPDYRTAFANDLKKMLPRIPLVEKVEDFWAFSKAGRQLAALHINYESVPPYPGVRFSNPKAKNFIVSKMKFPKKGQKDSIIYNDEITISNIPEKAYEYVVNGKSAIEWIMDRYQVKVDPKSGIKNDPNDWAKEQKKPRYILDLLLSIINLSVKTVDIVNSLPRLTFDTSKEE